MLKPCGSRRRGADRDPKSARALSYLGINALRTGEIERGRTALDQSFKLDPFDPWTKNTLDLLDTFKDYVEVRTPRFIVMIEKKDADAARAIRRGAGGAGVRFARRSLWPPARAADPDRDLPVARGLFRAHGGPDGPGGAGRELRPRRGHGLARGAGGSASSTGAVTLWHELGHVFTLGATSGRVPRWLSEGLSVYEERRARPSWGEDPSPLFFATYAAGQLPEGEPPE